MLQESLRELRTCRGTRETPQTNGTRGHRACSYSGQRMIGRSCRVRERAVLMLALAAAMIATGDEDGCPILQSRAFGRWTTRIGGSHWGRAHPASEQGQTCKRGKPLDALKCFKQALKAEPKDVELRRQLAKLYMELGRQDIALNHLLFVRSLSSGTFFAVHALHPGPCPPMRRYL